tara:strand:+ start:611 stop:790 length:180 start_codon:yes stop_codon:yes gene_type:complete
MQDINGNIVVVGTYLYAVNNNKLWFGKVEEVIGAKVRVFIFESGKTLIKTSKTIICPLD